MFCISKTVSKEVKQEYLSWWVMLISQRKGEAAAFNLGLLGLLTRTQLNCKVQKSMCICLWRVCIYVCLCACVCVCIQRERKTREGKRQKYKLWHWQKLVKNRRHSIWKKKKNIYIYVKDHMEQITYRKHWELNLKQNCLNEIMLNMWQLFNLVWQYNYASVGSVYLQIANVYVHKRSFIKYHSETAVKTQ